MFMHTPPPPPPRPMPITVFVHGTQFHTLVQDADLSGFFPPDTQTPAGLHAATELPDEHKIKKIMYALSRNDNIQFPFEGIYAFGWSGENLVSVREKAGAECIGLLKALAQEYESLHHAPAEITVITHSHGGNVLLHGIQHAQEPLAIARAVLLACPVQEATKEFIKKPALQQVYSFHSHTEFTQIADPQVMQPVRELIEKKTVHPTALKEALRRIRKMPLLSEQHFPPQQNLIQAEICWNSAPDSTLFKDRSILVEYTLYNLKNMFNPFALIKKRGLFHSEFTTNLFMAQLPLLIKQADSAPPVSNDLALFIDGA